MKTEYSSDETITHFSQRKLKKAAEKTKKEIDKINRDKNNSLDLWYFLKREDLAVIKWGQNLTVIDMKKGVIYRAFSTSSGLITCQVSFDKKKSYGSFRKDFGKLISGGSWLAGKFEIIPAEDSENLRLRLKKYGIELENFFSRKPSLSYLKSLVSFLKQVDPEQSPNFIAIEFRKFQA